MLLLLLEKTIDDAVPWSIVCCSEEAVFVDVVLDLDVLDRTGRQGCRRRSIPAVIDRLLLLPDRPFLLYGRPFLLPDRLPCCRCCCRTTWRDVIHAY